MKYRHLIGASILAFSSGAILAQSDTSHLMKWKPSSFEILRGFQADNYSNLDASYFAKLNNQVSDYLSDTPNQWSNTYSYQSKNIGFFTEFSRLMPDKKNYRKNQSLRVGIMYQDRNLGTINGTQNTTTSYDTYSSDNNGKKLYYEHIEYENYTISHKVQELKLDAAYIFRTSDQHQLNLFGGIGINLGASLFSKVNIYQNTGSRYYYSNADASVTYSGNFGYGNNQDNKIKTLNSKNFVSTGIYIPLGIDYRLSMNDNFFSRLHTIFEARPYLEFAKAQTLTSIHYNLAFKVDL
jgi:hypothetical protein